MNPFFVRGICISGCLLFSSLVLAEDQPDVHAVEEVLITGLPLEQAASETALPINILSGDALRENASATLGDTLEQQPGLRSASFGAGVGRPLIRGQGSTRVRVLQNGTGSVDVAAVSPDHGNAVEPLIARQIEVIRGPATLLYGNGAIGGVVNVVDNRIPQEQTQNQVLAEYRHNTVNHGDTLVSTLDGISQNFAWHLDFTLRENGDVSIPGFAAREEEHGEEEEHVEEHEEEHENTYGFIGNSQQRTKNIAGGFSLIGDEGLLGFSLSHLENNYGIPPGVHEHHEEEEAEEAHEEEEHEEEGENIRLDLKQDRFEFQALRENLGVFRKLDMKGNYSDYQHRELSAQHGGAGTVFTKQGYELRATAQLDTLNRTVLGLQLQNQDFDSNGEEAYLPATGEHNLGIFGLYNIETERWIFETGARYERTEIETHACGDSVHTGSVSASAIAKLTSASQAVVALTRSQRAPAMEELFSNIDPGTCGQLAQPITHFATGLIEIGNPDLKRETSSNMEVSWRKFAGDLRAELTLFGNEVDDYIFLHIIDDTAEEALARFAQRDACFVGAELALTWPLANWRDSHLDLSFMGDYVEAKFTQEGSAPAEQGWLPRIPPLRLGAELAWWSRALHLKLRVSENMKQDNLGAGETATPGYTRVDLFSEFHWNNGSVFVKVNNLLDEEIRQHSSWIKDAVPEPGRGIEVGTRLVF